MKKQIIKLAAALLLSAGFTTLAHADISIVGYWTMKQYVEPNLTTYASQGICILSNNTWYGTQQLWNGNWYQQGNEVKIYGTAPIYHAGGTANIATVGFGELHSPTTMSGQYAEWNVPGTPPLFWDRHYTYDMTFVSSTCPAASTVMGAG